MATLELVGLLSGNSDWQCKHIARNIVLDCNLNPPGFDHPDLITCGKRFESEQTGKLDSFIKPKIGIMNYYAKSNEIGYLRRLLETIALDAKKDGSFTTTPSDDKYEDFTVVTYLSCRDFAEYWLYPKRKMDEDDVKKEVEGFFEKASPGDFGKDWQRKYFEGLERGYYLMGEDRVVWVTKGNESSPHRKDELSSLSPSDKAAKVVRLMGLEGYETDVILKQKVGLIALTYKIPMKSLYIPNIIDARFGPYFFPGYVNEEHGRVASLNSSSESPYERDAGNSDVLEWVHRSFPLKDIGYEIGVDLVGYF